MAVLKVACTMTVPLRLAVKVVVALPEALVAEDEDEKVPLPVPPVMLQTMLAPFTGTPLSVSVAVTVDVPPLLMLDGTAFTLRA